LSIDIWKERIFKESACIKERHESESQAAEKNNSEPVALVAPSSICEVIISDLLVKGIPLEYARSVAILIVGGNVARVYCK